MASLFGFSMVQSDGGKNPLSKSSVYGDAKPGPASATLKETNAESFDAVLSVPNAFTSVIIA